MEPLFFKAENVSALLASSKRNVASMEPLFFKAENKRQVGLHRRSK